MHVLTTWLPPQRGLNEAGNAVSLKIRMGADRLVRPTRWINGMVFSSQTRARMYLSASHSHGRDKQDELK
jgi:hypothetical protein